MTIDLFRVALAAALAVVLAGGALFFSRQAEAAGGIELSTVRWSASSQASPRAEGDLYRVLAAVARFPRPAL
jgi:hypothetical protein